MAGLHKERRPLATAVVSLKITIFLQHRHPGLLLFKKEGAPVHRALVMTITAMVVIWRIHAKDGHARPLIFAPARLMRRLFFP